MNTKTQRQFQIFCRYCNNLLFKTKEPIYGLFLMEMKCPRCKRILKNSNDITIGKGKILDKRPLIA